VKKNENRQLDKGIGGRGALILMDVAHKREARVSVAKLSKKKGNKMHVGGNLQPGGGMHPPNPS
jgi:hypothetical protein